MPCAMLPIMCVLALLAAGRPGTAVPPAERDAVAPPSGWVHTIEGRGATSVTPTDRFPEKEDVVCVEDATPSGRVLARSLFGTPVDLDAPKASVELSLMVEQADAAFFGLDVLLNAAPRDWRHAADLLFTQPKNGPLQVVTYDGSQTHALTPWEFRRWYRVRFSDFDTTAMTYTVAVDEQRFPNQKLRGTPKRLVEFCVRTDRAGQIRAYVANVRPPVGVRRPVQRGAPLRIPGTTAALMEMSGPGRRVGEHALLSDDAQFLYFRSAELGLVFEKERLTLVGMFDRSLGVNLLTDRQAQPTWELLLELGPPPGRGWVATNLDAQACATDVTGDRLALHWHELRTGERTLAIDVTAEVRFDSAGATRWTGRVRNGDESAGVLHFDLPKLAFRRTANADQTFLAIPRMFGLRVRNPFAGRSLAFSHFALDRGVAYPGWLNMSFFTLADRTTDRQVFVHCRDPEARSKEFHVAPDPFNDALQCAVRHVPDDLGRVATPFAVPYETEVALIRGDWYDACQRYRTWATRQEWCARGPLSSRPSEQQWLSRVPLAFAVFTNEPADSGHTQALVQDLLAYRRYFGLPMYVVWYYWNRYDPQQTIFEERAPGVVRTSNYHAGSQFAAKPAFATAVEQLADDGVDVLPFVPTRLFDQGVSDADAARPWVVKDASGKPTLYSPHYGTWEICNSAAWWHRRLLRICAGLTSDLGIRGFYLDTHGMVQHPCFDRGHGHALGGGTFQSAGQSALTRYLQRGLCRINPGVVLQNECGSENYIDTVDARLVHVNVWEPGGSAPLYTAVYHDYQTEYGHRIAFGDADGGDPINLMTAANLFVLGMQIGRIYPSRGRNSFAERWANDAFYREQLAFIRRLARYRYHAWPFLGAGRFLRPLELGQLPVVYTENNKTITTKGVRCGLPVVLSSVWRAHNGDVAVVLVNLGRETRRVPVSLARDPDALIPGAPYTVSAMDEYGRTTRLGRVAPEGAFDRPFHVAPRDVGFLVFKPE